jgi:putative flippase GtrA
VSRRPAHRPLAMIRSAIDVRQFLTYMCVGLIGTGVQYLFLVALVRLWQADPVWASGCGFCVGAVANYYANYHLTFRSRGRRARTMGRFFAIALCGLAVNTGVMALMNRGFHVHYLLSQIVATGTVVVLTYLGNRFWTFREVGHV